MKAIKDGGPAFPRPAGWNHCERYNESDHSESQTGMTLRDWFAGQALAGMLANGFLSDEARKAMNYDNGAIISYTEAAYALADKMLKARSA